MHLGNRLTVAMFAGGVATFAGLYAIQAVLPALSGALRISESVASLTISVATGALALAVLPWAQVADRIGRTSAMRIAVIVAAVAGLVLPLAPTVVVLLAVRAVSGAALAAVPALAMAHLVEHAPPGRAAAMGGTYIAGTTVGGLAGRILTGTVAGLVGGSQGWQWGLVATGLAVAALAAVFAILLPRTDSRAGGRADSRSGARVYSRAGSRAHGREKGPVPRAPGAAAGRIRTAMAGRAVWSLYAQGFLLMGGFVTVYNMLAFRLLAPPYRIPASLVSLMFVIYLVGTASSSAVGRFVARFGRRPAMLAGGIGMAGGALVTMLRPLPLVIVGLVVVTFCFFVAHAVAAAWVGVLVPAARSQATALYSLTYYLGSSLVGYLGAVIFTWAGWTGAAVMVAGCAGLAVTVAALFAPGRARPATAG